MDGVVALGAIFVGIAVAYLGLYENKDWIVRLGVALMIGGWVWIIIVFFLMELGVK